MKIFYRVGNVKTQQGLWYDFNGNFTGLIHGQYNFCSANVLPMPFDQQVVGWLSATDTLENLFYWFTKDDLKLLEPQGFFIGVYSATDYRQYENHWLINQATSKFMKNIRLIDLG